MAAKREERENNSQSEYAIRYIPPIRRQGQILHSTVSTPHPSFYLLHQTFNFLFVVLLLHLLYVKFHIRFGVEKVFLEIKLLEGRVHVQPFGAKVVCTRHVGDHAFSVFPNLWGSHPHVPIPELVGSWPIGLQLIFVKFSL